jgi:hypothetical protein
VHRDYDFLETMAVMATRAEKKGKLRKEPQACSGPHLAGASSASL